MDDEGERRWMRWRCWVRVLAEVKVKVEDVEEKWWMRWRWRVSI